MQWYLLPTLSFLLLGLTRSSATQSKGFLSRSRLVAGSGKKAPLEEPLNILGDRKLLQIRGGALSVSKTSVAKVATVVSLAHGAVAFLKPTSVLQSYGMPTSPLAEITMRRLGVVLLQIGILGMCFFSDNLSVNTAIGAASLGFVVEIARCLLQNEPKTIGFAAAPQVLILLQCAAVSYVNLSNLGSVDIVNKVNTGWVMMNSCLFAFFPNFILEVGWGMQRPDDKTLSMISGFGLWFIAYSIYLGALVWGIEPIKALSWNRLFILLIHLIPTAGGSIGVSKTKQVALFAYQAIILAALAL